MKSLTDPLARILIGVIFIITGTMKLTHFSGTAHTLAGMGVPLATVAAAIAILIELGGGIAIVIGWQTKFAAALQFVYLIPVTLMIHNFWAAPPAMHDDQMIHFLKNLAIMGGLLILATAARARLPWTVPQDAPELCTAGALAVLFYLREELDYRPQTK